MKQVLEAAGERDTFRTREIADHPAVDISTRQVRDHLNTLAERGYINREYDGNGYVYQDDGLHKATEHGDVEIDAVELDTEEGSEVARNSIYTWEFRPSGGEPESDPVDGEVNGGENRSATATGGSDPPDRGD